LAVQDVKILIVQAKEYRPTFFVLVALRFLSGTVEMLHPALDYMSLGQ